MKKAQSNNLIIMFISIVVIALLFMWIFGYQQGSLNNFFGIFNHGNTTEGFEQNKKCDVETNDYRYVMKPIISDDENVVYYETCDFNDLQTSYEGILNRTITTITINGDSVVTLDTSNLKIDVYENKVNGELLKSINFNEIENESGGIFSLYYIGENNVSETNYIR